MTNIMKRLMAVFMTLVMCATMFFGLSFSAQAADAHITQPSYNDTRSLFQYTDSQNNGNPDKISSFYSGNEIGPGWTYPEWSREHTWPNSKGTAAGNGDVVKVSSADAKLTVNGEEVELDGKQYKIGEIKATEFGNNYEFKLYDSNDNLIQKLTYSINAYAYVKYHNGKTQEMQDLAYALYNYGYWATKYADSHQ